MTYKAQRDDKVCVPFLTWSAVVAMDLIPGTSCSSPVHSAHSQGKYNCHNDTPPEIVHPVFAPDEEKAKRDQTCAHGDGGGANNVRPTQNDSVVSSAVVAQIMHLSDRRSSADTTNA